MTELSPEILERAKALFEWIKDGRFRYLYLSDICFGEVDAGTEIYSMNLDANLDVIGNGPFKTIKEAKADLLDRAARAIAPALEKYDKQKEVNNDC